MGLAEAGRWRRGPRRRPLFGSPFRLFLCLVVVDRLSAIAGPPRHTPLTPPPNRINQLLFLFTRNMSHPELSKCEELASIVRSFQFNCFYSLPLSTSHPSTLDPRIYNMSIHPIAFIEGTEIKTLMPKGAA